MIYPSASLRELGVSVLDCEHKTPKPVASGHPYIAIPDIQDGRIVLATARQISDEDLAEWTRRTTPRSGDLVVTRRGRVGDAAPIPDGLKCAIGQNLVLLRSNGLDIDQSFLRWAARSDQWLGEVARLINVGAIFSSLNVKDIARIRIPKPPKSEQRAIAEVLGALDDKIATNTRLAATAIELVMSRFARLLRQSRSESVPVESLVRRLVQPRKFAAPDFFARGDFPVYDQSAAGFLGYAQGSGSLEASAKNPILYFGDHTCILRLSIERFAVGPNTVPFVGFEIPSIVLFCALQGAQKHEEYKRHWQDLMTRYVEVPTRDAADDFAVQNTPIFELRDALGAENQTLAATRDALLPQLMSGKLRVRDAEQAVEAVV